MWAVLIAIGALSAWIILGTFQRVRIQECAVGILSDRGEMSGPEIRRAIPIRHGLGDFYAAMAELESLGMVRGWTVPEQIDDQTFNIRWYRINPE